MGSRVEKTHSKVAAGGLERARLWPVFQEHALQWLAKHAVPHLHLQINWEEQLGSKIDHATPQPRVPTWRDKAWKPLTEKFCGGWGSRRNSQTHRRVHWRDPWGPRTYTKRPTEESTPERPDLLLGSGESDWKLAESGARCIVPF